MFANRVRFVVVVVAAGGTVVVIVLATIALALQSPEWLQSEMIMAIHVICKRF